MIPLYLATLNQLIWNRDAASLKTALKELSASEIADLIGDQSDEDQNFVFSLLTIDEAAEAFTYLPARIQKSILDTLPKKKVTSLLTAMSPDDRTAFLQEMPRKVIDEYLRVLPAAERNIALTLLGFPEDSVGRLMTTDYIAVKMDWTVEEVLEHIRAYGHDSETIDLIYVIDNDDKLLDEIKLKDFLFVPKELKVEQISDHKFVALAILDTIEKAIEVFRNNNRLALPVIDEEGLMWGIVTIDDILRISSQENTEEMQKFGGTEALDEPYLETPFLDLMKKRARWLVLLFIGEMFTATAMGFFEEEIARAVILALFLPLIISSGGNAGSQSSTLIIRAMALNEISLFDWWKTMKRELLSGLFLGVILGTVGFFRVTLWSRVANTYGEHWLLVAITIFLSLIGVVLWGSVSGAMLPFVLRRLGFDPATAAAPLVATIVDVTGIIIYFLIAMCILKGTLL